MKIDGRTLTHQSLEDIRQMAVRRVREGERPSAVIASYGLCRTTIYKWLRAERWGGVEALKSRKATGRPPVLTEKQQMKVVEWLCGKDPRQYGFDFGLWTRQIVAELIERKFKKKLSVASVGRLLHAWGITPQKPLRRAAGRPRSQPAASAKPSTPSRRSTPAARSGTRSLPGGLTLAGSSSFSSTS
jgi:transposase